MAHNPYELMISLSIDDMLTPDEDRELRQHVADCASCADLWHEMRQLELMFHRPVQVAPPADFTARVMNRVSVYETRRNAQPWIIGVLVVASLAAALSIAAPILFFSLGMRDVIAGWPVIGTILTFMMQVVTYMRAGMLLVVDAIDQWLALVTGEPMILAVVVSALVLASIWIGMMEVNKATQLPVTQRNA